MQLRRLGVILFLCTGVVTTAAVGGREPATDQQEPWRISWEDRMSRRFSAADQERRAKDYALRHGEPILGRPYVVIDGATDPELFTRTELFDQLLSTAFAPDARARAFWRDQYENRLPGTLVSPDLWLQIEHAASDYLRAESKRREWGRQAPVSPSPSSEPLQDVVSAPAEDDSSCARRTAALTATKGKLGSEVLDLVLYRAVAAHMTMTDTLNRAEVEYIERGCK